jgi:hypothetical protein
MNPNFRKVALIAAALGLLVSLFIALSSDGDDEATLVTTTAPPATPPATTASDGPVRITIDTTKGGIYRGTVKQGREVVITVRSPVTDHAHLHAYDIKADVAPGKPGRIEFTASIPGQFEIELEERHRLIGVLEVRG